MNEYDDNGGFAISLLEAYFKFRSNLPMTDRETGLNYKKQFKTTQDIASELDVMGGVQVEKINKYMQQHGYVLATLPDGTVAWAIWERVMPIT